MCAQVLSWWGPSWRQGTHDTQGVCTDDTLTVVLRVVKQYADMRVAFHMEPYPDRNIAMLREDLEHLAAATADCSTALLRIDGKPVYYLYDSYHIPNSDWAMLLGPKSSESVRGTPLDGFFIGLWLGQGDGDGHIAPCHFDGFYTYFSSDGVSFGSDPNNWQQLSEWAASNNRMFIASVGPGYNDTKIRPWNAAATRDRLDGKR